MSFIRFHASLNLVTMNAPQRHWNEKKKQHISFGIRNRNIALAHTQKISDSMSGQYLIDNPVCAKIKNTCHYCIDCFSNDCFRILSIGRLSLHLKMLVFLHFESTIVFLFVNKSCSLFSETVWYYLSWPTDFFYGI